MVCELVKTKNMAREFVKTKNMVREFVNRTPGDSDISSFHIKSFIADSSIL